MAVPTSVSLEMPVHAGRGVRRASLTLMSAKSVSGAGSIAIKGRIGCIVKHRKLLKPYAKISKTSSRGKPSGSGAVGAHFMAGAAGGGIATYSTHWLDTVKVRMQTNPQLYSSGTQCLKNTLTQEGLRGLYKGATPAVLGNMAKASVVFTSYGLCQNLVKKVCKRQKADDLSVAQHACAGAMTAVIASFVLCPLEVVKCNMQTNSSENKKTCRPTVVVRNTFSSQGIRGFYRGITGIWTKEIPGSFIYFGSYESAKSAMRRMTGKDKLDAPRTFGCGVVAGLAFSLLHPIESVKTRVQVSALPHTTTRASSPNKTSPGFFRACVYILKTEGMKPLWSGLRPCMARACLFSGIQFVVFESVKDTLIKDRRNT